MKLFERVETAEGVDLTLFPDCDDAIMLIQRGQYSMINAQNKSTITRTGNAIITSKFFLQSKVSLKCIERGVIWKLSSTNFNQIIKFIFHKNMEKLKDLSKGNTLFSLLTQEQIMGLSEDLVQIKYHKSEFMFIESTEVDYFYYITNGMVRYTAPNLSCSVHLESKDYIGYERIFYSNERRGEAYALISTNCFVFPMEVFKKYFSSQFNYFENYRMKVVIRSLPQYHAITCKFKDRIFDKMVEKTYEINDEIFTSHAEATEFYIIKSGELKVMQ